MNKCLNCNKEITDNKIYCDELCKYGFRTRMYHLMDTEFTKRLREFD